MKQMSVFGVGPIYGVVSIGTTLLAIIISYFFGPFIKMPFIIEFSLNLLAVILLIFALYLYFRSVLVGRIATKVKSGELKTDGVYALVRHPIYAALLYINASALFLSGDLALVFSIIFDYLFLWILVSQTEEKWLRAKFGSRYTHYQAQVNCCLPKYESLKRKFFK